LPGPASQRGTICGQAIRMMLLATGYRKTRPWRSKKLKKSDLQLFGSHCGAIGDVRAVREERAG
jgi:hypothetical protein